MSELGLPKKAMSFFPCLADTLQRSPFHNHGGYKFNITQCQALCLYFSSNLHRLFGNDISLTSSKPDKSKLWSTKESRFTMKSLLQEMTLSRWWSTCDKTGGQSMTSSSDEDISSILDELQSAPLAIQELYRVIKEAEMFLDACRASKWWVTAVIHGSSTEAYDIHFHDLMWCIAGLKLALQSMRGATVESQEQIMRQGITQCYAEMEAQVSDHVSCREQDIQSLLSRLQKMKNKNDKVNLISKTFWSASKKLMHSTVSFLAQRLAVLAGKGELECASFISKKLPASLFISSQDLIIPSRPYLIGSGNYASVFQASWLGLKVAAKQFNYRDSKTSFEHEAAVLVELMACPFIVQLLGWSVDSGRNTCSLVLEHLQCDLASYITERRELREPLQLPVLIDILLQISRAMEYMHSKNMMHRDLKPSNVLVQPLGSCKELMQEGYARIKLCDFGLARRNVDGCYGMTPRVGTLVYRAPEVWPLSTESEADSALYSFEADVYSFGMTCAYCLTGQEPFGCIKTTGELKGMLKRGIRPELPSFCPPFLNEFIQKCWSLNPISRPPFSTITMTLRQFKLLLMKTRHIEVFPGFLAKSEVPVSPALISNEQLTGFLSKSEISLPTIIISYEELVNVTSNFTCRAENVTLDSSFCGDLSDGTSILVLQIKSPAQNNRFWTEISKKLELRHSNVVPFYATCIHDSRSWCVYKYTHKQGSLDVWLHVANQMCKPLAIKDCYRVLVGVACGIQYLHAQEVLFSVTAERVLLDEEFEPQLLIDHLTCEEKFDSKQQRLDVQQFGCFVEQILSYINIHHGLNSGENWKFCEAQSLCLNEKTVGMDRVVEMVESFFYPAGGVLSEFSGHLADAAAVNSTMQLF